MLPKGKQWEEVAMEEGFMIWFCSSTRGCWTAALDRWAETPSWSTTLLFVNGVWTTSLDKYVTEMAGSWQVRWTLLFLLSWIKLVWLARCQGECGKWSLSLSMWLSPSKKMVIILNSFTKGCSDRCELLGCYGSANGDMLSEVWYSRKGFLARKTGPVLWNDGFSDFIVLTCFYSSY